MINYVTKITHLLLTRDWECCPACRSSYVKESALWVDSQKVGVGLLCPVDVQEVKADLLVKDKFGSTYKW